MTEPQDDSEVLNSRTGAGLLLFYEVKEKKHELTEGVVSPLRTATKRMLEVADAEPENVDLTTLDLDELFVRFRNKNSARLTDKSYAAYVSRFRRGITMYLRCLDHDPNWRGKARPTSSGGGNVKSAKATPINKSSRVEDGVVAEEPHRGATRRHHAPTPDQPLIDYKIPLLDSGTTAILWLPRTYTEADAARMTALINALAVSSSSSPTGDA